jgi:hypothetical protein
MKTNIMVYDDDWTGELNAEDYEPYEAAMARFDAHLAAMQENCRHDSREITESFHAKWEDDERNRARQADDAAAAKVKAETSMEMFRRISQAKEAKTVKATKSAAAKSVKKKQMKRLPACFVSK